MVRDLTGVSPQIAWDPTESTAKHGNNRVNGHRGKSLAPQLTIQRAKPRSRNDEVRSSESELGSVGTRNFETVRGGNINGYG